MTFRSRGTDRQTDEVQCVIVILHVMMYTVVQKNAPTLADYNYDPVQSILIIFSKLFVNDHKSCLVVKIFHLTAHMLPLYLVKHNALFFTNYTAYRKKMRQLRITITSISVKEF